MAMMLVLVPRARCTHRTPARKPNLRSGAGFGLLWSTGAAGLEPATPGFGAARPTDFTLDASLRWRRTPALATPLDSTHDARTQTTS